MAQGTYDFIAVEVEVGAYLNQTYMNQVDGVFSHNPLHDLESLWWVGVWFLLCHYDPGRIKDIPVQKHVEVVKQFGGTLFNNRIDPLSRRRALISTALLVNIQPGSFPTAIQHFILLLDLFREQLVVHYKDYRPSMTSQDWSFFNPNLHRKYCDLVEVTIKELKNDSTPLWLIRHIEEHIGYLNKRKFQGG